MYYLYGLYSLRTPVLYFPDQYVRTIYGLNITTNFTQLLPHKHLGKEILCSLTQNLGYGSESGFRDANVYAM